MTKEKEEKKTEKVGNKVKGWKIKVGVCSINVPRIAFMGSAL